MNRNIVETIVGALVLVVAGVFVFYAFAKSDRTGPDGYEITARFGRIDGLKRGADVTLSGVKIGTVTAIDLDKKKTIAGLRRKRWVMYNGEPEASRVPADWHGWLHYTTDTPPPQGGVPRKAWQKEHLPNLTGTPLAYRPPGSAAIESPETKPKPPYEAWRPG